MDGGKRMNKKLSIILAFIQEWNKTKKKRKRKKWWIEKLENAIEQKFEDYGEM